MKSFSCEGVVLKLKFMAGSVFEVIGPSQCYCQSRVAAPVKTCFWPLKGYKGLQ